MVVLIVMMVNHEINYPLEPISLKDTVFTKKQKETEQYFQFLGFVFKFDDLLILFLLYFLYAQKVKDFSLFMILLLLLFN